MKATIFTFCVGFLSFFILGSSTQAQTTKEFNAFKTEVISLAAETACAANLGQVYESLSATSKKAIEHCISNDFDIEAVQKSLSEDEQTQVKSEMMLASMMMMNTVDYEGLQAKAEALRQKYGAEKTDKMLEMMAGQSDTLANSLIRKMKRENNCSVPERLIRRVIASASRHLKNQK